MSVADKKPSYNPYLFHLRYPHALPQQTMYSATISTQVTWIIGSINDILINRSSRRRSVRGADSSQKLSKSLNWGLSTWKGVRTCLHYCLINVLTFGVNIDHFKLDVIWSLGLFQLVLTVIVLCILTRFHFASLKLFYLLTISDTSTPHKSSVLKCYFLAHFYFQIKISEDYK